MTERRTIEYITYECESCAHGGKYHDSACKFKKLTHRVSWSAVEAVQVHGNTYELVKANT